MQLRMSPGGRMPSSRRRRPDEPPSSVTVTTPVRRPRREVPAWCLSPRSSTDSPVPPPIATTLGGLGGLGGLGLDARSAASGGTDTAGVAGVAEEGEATGLAPPPLWLCRSSDPTTGPTSGLYQPNP